MFAGCRQRVADRRPENEMNQLVDSDLVDLEPLEHIGHLSGRRRRLTAADSSPSL